MQISEAESAVMDVLWSRSPRTAEDVAEALRASRDWQEPTVKTLLNRLLKKGAIAAERDGRRYLYAPLLARDAWVAQQSEGFVERIFGGRVAPLVAHFSERGRLTPEDLAELRRLVEGLDDER
ncbi:BlaI/MecI/CopY family transcriptional regulator [Luteimonas sp. RD2P54]|uniref:BlaI/MecI/CopY family transcriptional regulator n=1 Tax=Luteimonas endophytica TaxID=3042023 RepID=A0ABT6J7T2_9GAMM|nr:BlaI/MecI/CopY family transcriptional regulator [Luteimonas endophytica]MDH5822880.1 BlaI/MecI/CopY family transcriptional regulator [Luteimonas endophytica]